MTTIDAYGTISNVFPPVISQRTALVFLGQLKAGVCTDKPIQGRVCM